MRTSLKTRILCAAVLAAVTGGTVMQSKGATLFYVAGSGTWLPAGAWSSTNGGAGGAGPPKDTDIAIISVTDTIVHAITYDQTASNVTLTTFTMDEFGSGLLSVVQSGLTTVLSTHAFTVGQLGSGSYTLANGTATILGTFGIGNLSTGNGVVTVSNGTLTANTENVGTTGFGNSGTAGTGSVSQSGGTQNLGALSIGGGGNGTFSQSGGNVTVNSFHVGVATGGSGTYSLTGGTMTVAPTGGGSFIADGGNGAMNVGGGNFTLGTVSAQQPMFIARNGGNGTLTQTNGLMVINGDEYVGVDLNSNGTLNANGGSHSVTGTLYVGPSATTRDVVNVSGTLSATTIRNNSIININGGAINGLGVLASFINNATVNVTVGGNVNEILTNAAAGTLNVQNGTLTTAGTVNQGSIIVSGAGSLYGGITGGLDNEASVTVSGGTLAGSGTLVNNGSITGWGLITATSTNNGELMVQNGTMTVTAVMANNGTIDLTASHQLSLQSNLNNNSTVNLNSGSVTGTGTLANNAGGIVTGPGVISSPLTNAGLIYNSAGTLNIVSTFNSSGTIQLNGPTANLIGGVITNTGIIQGNGSVSSVVTNNGEIDAISGTLSFNGGFTNAGLIVAETGGKVIARNLVSNSGTISLTGGTFDTGGHTINNHGVISGYGTITTTGLTNSSSATFTGGVATINGAVSNSIGATMEVSNTSAFFTGNVTNFGTFISLKSAVTFSGTYTEFGTFISDPATQTFGNANIGAGGAWQGELGDRFIVSGNFISHSTASHVWNTDAAELAFSGGGAHTLGVGGADEGSSPVGYGNNFSWGEVALMSGTDGLVLENDSGGAKGALYVHDFVLPGGISQLGLISGPSDVTIYYDPNSASNAYLGGAMFALAGGASLAPVPEPASMGLLGIGAVALLSRRKKSGALS